MDFVPFIEKFRVQHADLEARLADPEIFSRQKEFQEVNQAFQRLNTVLKDYDRLVQVEQELLDSREMLTVEEDEAFRTEIEQEIVALEKEQESLTQAVKIQLVPPGPNDSRNTILEIHPAAGGDEAGLFAYELLRLYMRYAEKHNWKVEILELAENAVGGLKQAVCSIKGDQVFRKLHLESGVHRVQRVPATESQGRIHTSTVTVAILPEAEEIDCPISPDELRFDVFRASGAGGQHVNTTDSAVRVTHLPTGIFVASQQEKSQHKNKEIALRILRAKLITMRQEEEMAKYNADRKAQVGSGDRSERIRTYNFPQGRVTDHRFGITRYDLHLIMQGEIDDFFGQILGVESEQLLADYLESL